MDIDVYAGGLLRHIGGFLAGSAEVWCFSAGHLVVLKDFDGVVIVLWASVFAPSVITCVIVRECLASVALAMAEELIEGGDASFDEVTAFGGLLWAMVLGENAHRAFSAFGRGFICEASLFGGDGDSEGDVNALLPCFASDLFTDEDALIGAAPMLLNVRARGGGGER